LQDRFRAGLTSEFGPRSLSAALEDVIDLIGIARQHKVTWTQLASALRTSVTYIDAGTKLDPATLRGLCGRILRRKKRKPREDQRSRHIDAPAAAFKVLKAEATTTLREVAAATDSEAQSSSTDRSPKQPVLHDNASMLAEKLRRMKEIR
jgi:hypothetical protein